MNQLKHMAVLPEPLLKKLHVSTWHNIVPVCVRVCVCTNKQIHACTRLSAQRTRTGRDWWAETASSSTGSWKGILMANSTKAVPICLFVRNMKLWLAMAQSKRAPFGTAKSFAHALSWPWRVIEFATLERQQPEQQQHRRQRTSGGVAMQPTGLSNTSQRTLSGAARLSRSAIPPPKEWPIRPGRRIK